LRSINHPKIIDMGLIGVLPQYKNTGISWVMLSIAMNFLKSGVEYAETNLNLENNLAIQNTWNRFESVIHKRRRSYLKQL
jgi:ribosomal protein S18 acetylase RimI-like enzyme